MRCIKGILKVIAIVGILGGLIGVYARFIEPNLLKITRYQVKVPQQVAACKIVFFSDTHFGSLYSENHLERIVEKINRVSPDIVIFGGDLLDNYARDKSLLDIEGISSALGAIQANYGKYAVYGNHDYGGGALGTYKKIMSEAGFDLLNDNNVFVEDLNFRIIGFDDYLMGYTHPDLYTLKSETYNLIVSHEPDVSDLIKLNGEGVMLSGHSHGGQVSVPVITEKVLPTGAEKYVRGYYENSGQEGNLPLYVSTGIGVTAYPYRFLNIPEIMVLDLQPR